MRIRMMMSITFALWLSLPLRLFAASVQDAAKAEGEVVFYSSLNNEQIKTLTDRFQQKYPRIKASFYRGTSDRVLQRITTEAKAGRHTVDVFSSAGFQLQLLKDNGLTARYVPEESAAYEKGLKDADGHWVSVHSLLNSMAYNTNLVSAKDAPKKIEDLLQPKWKGKIGIDVGDAEWYVNLQRIMGKEEARRFLRRLAAQKVGLRRGHNLLAQLTAAGEFHVVLNTYAHIAARMKKQGAPIQWVFDEPVITYVHPIAVARHAPHPNAGRLFMTFVLSEEGQQMLRDQGRIPSHPNVDPDVFSLKNVKLFPSDPQWAKEFPVALEEMEKILSK
ncbi:MAG: ABC transporter substrate-binding protein [Candidatus Binatia bacterium]